MPMRQPPVAAICSRCEHPTNQHDDFGCKLGCPCPLTPCNIVSLFQRREKLTAGTDR